MRVIVDHLASGSTECLIKPLGFVFEPKETIVRTHVLRSLIVLGKIYLPVPQNDSSYFRQFVSSHAMNLQKERLVLGGFSFLLNIYPHPALSPMRFCISAINLLVMLKYA